MFSLVVRISLKIKSKQWYEEMKVEKQNTTHILLKKFIKFREFKKEIYTKNKLLSYNKITMWPYQTKQLLNRERSFSYWVNFRIYKKAGKKNKFSKKMRMNNKIVKFLKNLRENTINFKIIKINISRWWSNFRDVQITLKAKKFWGHSHAII